MCQVIPFDRDELNRIWLFDWVAFLCSWVLLGASVRFLSISLCTTSFFLHEFSVVLGLVYTTCLCCR